MPPARRSRGDVLALRVVGTILSIASLALFLFASVFFAFGTSIWRDFGAGGSDYWGSPMEGIASGAVMALVGFGMAWCAVLAFKGAAEPRETSDAIANRPPPPKHALAWFVFDIGVFVLLIVVLGLSARN